MPGWSGLANARVTMFGDVYLLSDDLQRGAREVHQFNLITTTRSCRSPVRLAKRAVKSEHSELVCDVLAVQIFLQKHASAKGERLVSGNSMFFRMHRILDIYFVGGFGTVQFLDVDEYKGTRPDAIVMDHPHQTLQARSLLRDRDMAPRIHTHGSSKGPPMHGSLPRGRCLLVPCCRKPSRKYNRNPFVRAAVPCTSDCASPHHPAADDLTS